MRRIRISARRAKQRVKRSWLTRRRKFGHSGHRPSAIKKLEKNLAIARMRKKMKAMK